MNIYLKIYVNDFKKLFIYVNVCIFFFKRLRLIVVNFFDVKICMEILSEFMMDQFVLNDLLEIDSGMVFLQCIKKILKIFFKNLCKSNED